MTPFQQFMDIGYHMILPIVTLTMLSIGGLMRYTRTNMLEVLSSDYIRTARAKGLSEKSGHKQTCLSEHLDPPCFRI